MRSTARQMVLGLALLGLPCQVRAITSDAGVNPYQTIPGKNAFNLQPILALEQPPKPQPTATKIRLQGITVLFGRKEALLRLPDPTEPGRPDKERSLIMTEGERWGAVEVVRIDPKAREVEFMDSGNSVKLKLAEFVTKTPIATPQPQQAQLAPKEQVIIMNDHGKIYSRRLQFTPEEQFIIMEVERGRNKNNPNYPPLPPTSVPPTSSMSPTVPPTPGK